MTDRQTDRQTERNLTIDIIRGVAVFCVVWGHYIQYSSGEQTFFGDPVFKVIYSFHMPLFALLSGYLFSGSLRKRSLKETIVSRITGLLIPIFMWSTLYWLFECLLHKKIDVFAVPGYWTDITFWFLWSIFAAQIVIALVMKLVTGKKRVLALVAGYFVMYLFPNPELNLFVYPFVVAGYAIGMAGSITVILIIQTIGKKWETLAVLGRYSLQIYIMQCFEMKLFVMVFRQMINYLGYNPLATSVYLFDLVITPVMAIVTIAVLIGVASLIKKIGWLNRICFGK